VADGDLDASIAPFQRYYLCIDATGAADSVEYGKLLEQMFGWRNLLSEFLEPDPKAAAGDDRLLDPNHPFLPICTFPPAPGRKKPIAIVCPGGRDGKALDAFWANYSGEAVDEKPDGRHSFGPPDLTPPKQTFGRVTAAFKSSLFMRELVLVPAIEKITDAQGRSFAQVKQGLLSGARKPTEPDVPAELLIISSHGWLGGFMHGDKPQPSTVAQPVQAQPRFSAPLFFIIGRAASERRFFFGPKWLILAQCSTVNAATWLSWVKVMMNSIPKVRGILAYEEVSPAVTGSIAIARDFFDRLSKGQTLLRAWRGANAREKWAAIVHKTAIGDVMVNWDRFDRDAPITSAQVTATDSSYLAFGASLERGSKKPNDGAGLVDFPAQNVLDKPPPFGLTVETADPGATPPRPFEEITEATQGEVRQVLLGEIQVRTTITAPPNAKIASATIRWVHMRESRNPQIPITSLFSAFASDPAGALQISISTKVPRTQSNTVDVVPTAGPVDRMVIIWTVQKEDVLRRSGLELAHSLIWPLIVIQVVGGKEPEESFPFSTQGLLF